MLTCMRAYACINKVTLMTDIYFFSIKPVHIVMYSKCIVQAIKAVFICYIQLCFSFSFLKMIFRSDHNNSEETGQRTTS